MMMTCKQCKKQYPRFIEVNGRKRDCKNRRMCVDCSPIGKFTDVQYRQCTTCDGTIPSRITINGETKHIRSTRKRCFQCSPFGVFAAKAHDVARSKAERARYKGQRRYDAHINESGEAPTTTRRNRRKAAILNFVGCRCAICGYDRCQRSLAFHHLFDKELDLTSRTFQYAFTKVKRELSKCVLVCHNCHTEIHEGMVSDSILNRKFAEMQKLLKPIMHFSKWSEVELELTVSG